MEARAAHALSATELARPWPRAQLSALEVTRAYLDAHRALRSRRSTPFCTSTRDGALARAAAVDRARAAGQPLGAARRRAGRAQGQPLHARPAHDLRVAHPRGLRAAVRRPRRRAPARGRRGGARQAQHGRVRDGLVERELGVRAGAQSRGTSRARRAARRAARRRRPRRASRAPRSAATPAARCASPRLLRRDRDQADLRARVALRPGRVRVVARPGRAARARRARRGAAARR